MGTYITHSVFQRCLFLKTRDTEDNGRWYAVICKTNVLFHDIHNGFLEAYSNNYTHLGIVHQKLPVPMAAQSRTRAVFNRSNTGIVGSNPARGMDVCAGFSVLCWPV